MSLIGLPRTVRSMQRLRTIARVLTRHGFGHLVERLNLRRFVPFAGRISRRPQEPDLISPSASIGRRLAMVCEELGPTFVKFGQLLSSRPDLLPATIAQELQRLQDQVAPFESSVARQIIADDLGAPADELFEQIDSQPFASGSIAQAYRAVARNGERVVVKVKRPGIESVIQLDVHILRWLAGAIERHIPELRIYRPVSIVAEFERTIRQELDLVNEASTTARFYRAFADDPDVLVPRVRWDLTGLDVLTVQRLAGRKLEEVLACDDGAVDRPAAAANLVRAFLKQYFELGMFHADPHPGNLLIAPPARLVMLDFGMVGQVDEEMATQLAIGLTAAVTQEVDILIDVLADLGALGPQTRRSQLRRDLRALLGKYYALPLKRLDPQGIFAALNDVIRQHDVQLPRDFVLLGKSLVTVGGVALQLDPELNLVELVRPRIRKMVAERLSPPRLLRLAGISSWHLLSIFKNAPRQLRDFLRRLGGGQMQINIRHENLDYLASELDRSSNRLAISVVIGATIVGSSMLVSMESGAQVLVLGLVSLRTFGFVGYFAAFVMGAWLVYAVWRSGKLS